MSITIPTRLEQSEEPERAAGVARSEPRGGERSDALAAPPRGPRIGRSLPAEVKALLPDELIDELLAGAKTEGEIAGPGGLLSQLTKRLVERAMELELTDHLGFEPHQEPPGGTGNTRNGLMSKR